MDGQTTTEKEVYLWCEPDTDNPCDVFDEETADSIAERSERNEWAWCTAFVGVLLKRLDASGKVVGAAYAHSALGNCSYNSKEDFENPEGDYPDMVNEATEEAQKSLDAQRGGGTDAIVLALPVTAQGERIYHFGKLVDTLVYQQQYNETPATEDIMNTLVEWLQGQGKTVLPFSGKRVNVIL